MSWVRDPDSVLDYVADWSAWLEAGETIVTSSWIVPTGIVMGPDTHDGTTATIWLSGGTNGTDYRITNRVVTTAGRTDDRSITIKVRQR